MNVKITNKIKEILHGEKLIDSALANMNKSVFDTDVYANNSELLNNVVSTVNYLLVENQKRINGSVLLTDTRIILYSKKALGGYYFKEIKINSVNKTTFKRHYFEYRIIFHTDYSDIKINMPNKNAAKKINKTLEACISKWKIDEKNILNLIECQIYVENPLIVGVEKPIKITIDNPTEISIFNIKIQSKISTLIKCNKPTVEIKAVQSNSSENTAIFITPRIADKIDLGNLNISYDINGNTYEKEPMAMGTYESVEETSYKPETYTDNINSDLSISRETEFYRGYIRFKMSVTNTSSFVVNDVALDFDYDYNLLRIDRREPDYQIKNGKTVFGNISVNSSKTIAVYFDPMMCSKGADINCQVNYKDAKGQPQTTHMKPKQISVVCPIMETESDINIGRLKEFIEKLPYRDSKVYQVQNGFDIDVLKNISREIVQKHDVKHIRTLFTKDRNTCEIWYYGKTKVHSHDIVIKITILSETQNIELFAATQTVESLAGLLAEVGRELKGAIESKVTGNVQQVINVSIKDSIVQRSNLLSYCDVDGNCSSDVVIEDSLVQRSDISNVEFENKGASKEMNKEKVYNYLITIVNNRSNIEDTKIGYKNVLNYFNRDTKYLPLLFTRLAEICKYNHERNEPLISAIVVNDETSIPGKGFFENCMRKYRGYIGPSDGPDAQKVHNEELERVFNYWQDGNENSCPACGGVVPDGAKFCMECGGKLI